MLDNPAAHPAAHPAAVKFTGQPSYVMEDFRHRMPELLVEEMGGSIDVDSEIGVGSCFHIHLPAAQ